MKKAIALFLPLFFLQTVAAIACPVCDKQQPKILRGITHGTGPQTNWDYAIVWAAVLIVLITLFYMVKWLIKPEEKNDDHIKRMVLN
jgi:phage shock protein PspC (stress-responsive transcriptional regulator)